VKLQEQEFFASRDEAIATAANAAARKKLIASLPDSRPALWAEWNAARRQSEGESHLLRNSGRYPLCGRGDVNTYSVFAELFHSSIEHAGRMGIITPTGLATDATTADFFAEALRTRQLVAFYDFENEAKVFAGIDHRVRFAVTCMSGGEIAPAAQLAFVIRHVTDVPSRSFDLTAEEILLLNPNTGTLPLFRSRRDAEIAIGIYRRHPILMKDGDPAGNPWGLSFGTMFHMANDSSLFHTASELEAIGAQYDGWAWSMAERRWLPLYEAKMLSHFDHRYATYENATQSQLNVGSLPKFTDEQHDDPNAEPLARYWVEVGALEAALPGKSPSGWLLGWRNITNAVVWRTLVPSLLPAAAVGHSFPLVFARDLSRLPLLQCVWSSLACDYLVRQKMSGVNLTFGVMKQIAVPIPEHMDEALPGLQQSLRDFILCRHLELSYTSYRMMDFAVGRGDSGTPFRWDSERRELLEAEINAAMLHLYGVSRDEALHILESFVVLQKNEESDLGEFRTKRLVLERYDAMAATATSGMPYETPIDPPPGFGPRHDPSTRPDWLKERA